MADVRLLYPIIKKWEGGFVNDPADSGGATNRGVTLETYRKYCKIKNKGYPSVENLKKITEDEVVDILRLFYWNPCKGDLINNQSVANIIVNSVWGSGLGYIKKIQQTIGVIPDGIVGPNTINVINLSNQKELFEKLWNRRKKFFEDITLNNIRQYEKKIGRKATEQELMKHTYKRFLKGWLNRLNDFKFNN